MEQRIVHRTVLVFLIVITSNYGQAGVKSFCNTTSAKEGEEALISCYFDTDINKVQKAVLLYLVNKKQPMFILSWNDGKPNINSDPGYEWGGTISDHIVIKIPKVNADQTGEYKCIVPPNEEGDERGCTLNILDFKEDGKECQNPFHIDCDKGDIRKKCPEICSSIVISVISTPASEERTDFLSKVTFPESQHKELPVTQYQEYLSDIRMTTESSSDNADTSDEDEKCTDKIPECDQQIPPCDNDGLMLQNCPKTCNACSTLLTTTYFKEDGKKCQNLFHPDCDKGDLRKKCPLLCSSIAISVIPTQVSTTVTTSHSKKNGLTKTYLFSTSVTSSHSEKNGLAETDMFSTILTSSYSKTYILTETGSSSATEPESTNSREDTEITSWFVAIIIVAVVIITATYAVKKKLGCGLNCIRLRIHSAHVRARCYRDSSVYQMVEMESGTQQFFLQDPSIHLYRYRDVQPDFETQTDCHDQQKSDVLSLLRSRFASTYKIMSSTSDSACQENAADKLQQGQGKWLLPIRKVFDRIVPNKSLPGENVQINEKEKQHLARARGPSEESMNQDGLVYANLDFSHLHMTDFRPPTAMEPTEYAAIDFQKCAKKIKD